MYDVLGIRMGRFPHFDHFKLNLVLEDTSSPLLKTSCSKSFLHRPILPGHRPVIPVAYLLIVNKHSVAPNFRSSCVY